MKLAGRQRLHSFAKFVLMKEKGIEGAVEKEKSNPLSKDDRAATPSPLGQIRLITDDGVSIYDRWDRGISRRRMRRSRDVAA